MTVANENKPDEKKATFEALDALNVRVGTLIRCGQWTEQAWNAAIDEVAQLTGQTDSAGWLIGEALDQSWIDRRIQAV